MDALFRFEVQEWNRHFLTYGFFRLFLTVLLIFVSMAAGSCIRYIIVIKFARHDVTQSSFLPLFILLSFLLCLAFFPAFCQALLQRPMVMQQPS